MLEGPSSPLSKQDNDLTGHTVCWPTIHRSGLSLIELPFNLGVVGSFLIIVSLNYIGLVSLSLVF